MDQFSFEVVDRFLSDAEIAIVALPFGDLRAWRAVLDRHDSWPRPALTDAPVLSPDYNQWATRPPSHSKVATLIAA